MLFSTPLSSFLPGFIDHHCHLLPGVDDGVRTMETALQVLQRYEEYGIAEVWCTPHVMEDIPNTTAHLQHRFAELQQHYHGPVQLHLAAEYMLDDLFRERLANRDLLPLGPDHNQLLVETSYFTPPMNFTETLREIRHQGYFPVLAHPERYVYMDKHHYDQLHQEGILLQLNIGSLVGAYGREAQRKARRLLRKGYYALAGTDLHSPRQFPLWEKRVLCNLQKLPR